MAPWLKLCTIATTQSQLITMMKQRQVLFAKPKASASQSERTPLVAAGREDKA